MAGAVVMLLPSMYPAAPATIHPTARPTMMEMFFKNGEPKSSVKMIETKDRNPRPINSGEPHLLEVAHERKCHRQGLRNSTDGRGLGAKMVGQSSKMPDVGRLEQSFEPPPQFGTPEAPIRDAPIIRMTVPKKPIEHLPRT